MLARLSDYQHDFPLVARPFAAIARDVGATEDAVLAALRECRERGALGRIGAVWERGAGGAAALCALRVDAGDLDRVAAIASAEPSVNHNYEREHEWRLWYVITAPTPSCVRDVARRVQSRAGTDALFLPMVRAYRVDLGFDLRDPLGRRRQHLVPASPIAVSADERPLARLAEEGIALVERPFDLWAAQLGCACDTVIATLRRWKDGGALRRFGIVVRHHDLGFDANAMTVLRAADGEADAIGHALARQPGVTLAYRRETDPRWPYNLYFMVHGRERGRVQTLVARAIEGAGAAHCPRETLFSARRFKQTGSRYFGEAIA